MRKISYRLAGFALVGFAMTALGAENAPGSSGERYPTRPIRLIIPNGPGGSTDLVARTVAHKLSEYLGKQIVADNRGGSGGIMGTETVARAAPDGYTLLVGTVGSIAISPHLYSKLGYDPVKDFSAVAQVSSAGYMLIVHPSLPVKSVKEFVALALTKPGQLHYASAGSGGGGHLATELFLAAAGIKVTHVPYKSGVAINTALLSGDVQMALNGIPSSLPLMKSGRVKALAVTMPNRATVAPEVPTFAEAGYPRAESTSWTGILVPAGTPRAVVMRLNTEIRKALESPDVKNAITAAGAETAGTTAEAFSAYVKSELAKWGKVIRDTGAKAD